MRILVISQYFPPETGATQNRLASLVEGFKEAGHEVYAIAEKPNYPAGIIWDEYKGGAFKDGMHKTIPVVYTWIWEDRKKKFFTRIRFYLSFVVMAILACFRIKGKFDVVVASSPPLFVGIAGWAISRIKGAKYVFDVRDLWPDVAIAMGELRNKRAASLAKSVEKFIYRKAHGITAVTDSFCEDIQRMVGGEKMIRRFTNGTVPEIFEVNKSKVALRQELNLSEKYYVLFAGNMGLAQGLDHVVDAANILQQKAPQVQFLFVGDGVRKANIATRSKELNLKNIDFLPRVPLKTAARYMNAADALLVPLGNNEIYKKFIPSKLFDSMAASKPVLLSVDGEARKILKEANSGVYYPAENAEGLANAILTLIKDPEESAAMGARGCAYVKEHFSRRTVAIKMAGFLEEVVHGNTAANPVPLSRKEKEAVS